jgi:hypothetical protein
MGFFKSAKGSIISDYFQLRENVGTLTAGNMVNVILYNDHLDIKEVKNSVSLNYSQITDVFYGMETEIVAKGKTVIGRAMAGGLIFGGVGAVVGAVSGTGTKDKKERHFYFIISYTSSTGEDKFIQLEDTRLYKGAKVAKKLKELCNITPAPDHVDL